MKTLLVPVDFSNFSEFALEAAADIAKKIGARMVVTHMIGLNDATLTRDETDAGEETIYLIKLTEKRFKEFLNKDYLKGLEVVSNVQKFKVFNDVERLVTQFKVDLIVMGSHGSSGLSEMFVGSNTEKVVRNAEVPVLVVKKPWNKLPLKTAVIACDFKAESINSYLKIHTWTEILGLDLHLLYINLPDPSFRSTDEITEMVENFFSLMPSVDKSKMLKSVKHYNDYSIEEGIFNYANEGNIDLIAMPTHGRKGIAHFFSGSIGEDVINHSKYPVLTVKI